MSQDLAQDLVVTNNLNINTEFATKRVNLQQNRLVNMAESKSFLASALSWHGSVTPRVLMRVIVTSLYTLAVYYIEPFFHGYSLSITPFEYSGSVLALILVLRVNAGQDRWWEARKIWGSIVNKSRNLALLVYGHSDQNKELRQTLLKWIAAWPHIMRESLRNELKLQEVSELIGEEETEKIRKSENMSMYVANKIISMLQLLKEKGMDPHSFLRAETERSQLIDAIGACERIRNTRMPLVLAINTRRFIFLFLLLLPFALVERTGWLTTLIVALASYPLFSLDEIGAELQNPFSPRNLSHLPLDSICKSISNNVLGLMDRD
jgi:putative membrane protein